MGIVLKRRDNAPIVKIVVGGIIDSILYERSIDKAVEYTNNVLEKLMNGYYSMDKFIITKTLRANYAHPKSIAHKVLADRIAERDPGNKPQVNDRIPFIYIVKNFGKKKKKDILQGDLIETPEYIIRNKLKIDYLYYLEHQIIKPASQILELMLSKRKVDKLFNKFIIQEESKRIGRQTMDKWIDPSKTKYNKIEVLDAEKNKEKPNKLLMIGNSKRLENQNLMKWMSGPSEEISDDDITEELFN
jgi:DNA polymerase elongation subunit (family B)